MVLNATGSTGKSRVRTHDIMKYQPGCMPVIQLTGMLSDNNNWVLQCVRRTSTSGSSEDIVVSTITGYDASKANRYEIRFAYLGVQTVQFFINGTLVAQETYAGILDRPYLRTPNLPISCGIMNNTDSTQEVKFGLFDDLDGLFFRWKRTAQNAAPAHVEYKCASARLVGGGDYHAHTFGFSHATTGVGTTIVPLFSMRVNNLLNTVSSSIQVFPEQISFF